MRRISVVAAFAFAVGAGAAVAVPPENEYDLRVPTAEGAGEDPQAHAGETEFEPEPAPSSKAAPAESTPAESSETPFEPKPPRERIERPGPRDGAPAHPPSALDEPESSQPPDSGDASAGGFPGILILLGGLGLLVAAAGAWRRTRAR